MSDLLCQPTALPGVLLLQPKLYRDPRGFFRETYHAEKLAACGVRCAFVQDNHSLSKKGVLRGLHYQVRQPQGKLVRVVRGEIFDAVVDIRRSSPTFGRAVWTNISSDNKRMIWVPPGFAHGFMVISDCAEVLYKTTDYYAPEFERTIRWNDPQIAIPWPLGGMTPTLSKKDQAGAGLREAEVFD